MKKILIIAACAFCFNISAHAQVKDEVKKGAQEVKEGAQKAGDKTAEVAAKGAAHVTDQVYEGKEGPKGQTIYIDNNSKYYYIDDKGHKNYIAKGSLIDKK
ncbi:MAG: hypothetical protein EOP51_00860 [Sphingobacteriales bacterium]|nr:MAG: hypothetical protein EOP51_00860 [Sphingobacteriales bacterium]